MKYCVLSRLDVLWESITMTSHGRHVVSNHWHIGCLLNSLFTLTTKKTLTFYITGPLWRESVTGGFSSQRAINAESVNIAWRHDASPPSAAMTQLIKQPHNVMRSLRYHNVIITLSYTFSFQRRALRHVYRWQVQMNQSIFNVCDSCYSYKIERNQQVFK